MIEIGKIAKESFGGTVSLVPPITGFNIASNHFVLLRFHFGINFEENDSFKTLCEIPEVDEMDWEERKNWMNDELENFNIWINNQSQITNFVYMCGIADWILDCSVQHVLLKNTGVSPEIEFKEMEKGVYLEFEHHLRSQVAEYKSAVRQQTDEPSASISRFLEAWKANSVHS
jgi:hypothetical protein